MSDNSIPKNQTISALHRLTGKYDAAAEKIAEFTRRQAEGEQPDPAEFMQLLQQRLVTQDAMHAQFKLHEKPLKTVLNETR